MEDNIAGLADAINALRHELAAAQRDLADDTIRFRVNKIELTVNAVVVKGIRGGVGWGVISLGGKTESALTHTLRLDLSPVLDMPEGEIEFRAAASGRATPRFGSETDE